ncbi:CDP-diacylglycerol--glycerol-3-phosphate 3-phosphatidyltransferase [Wansuia hejianensis]|uniref:CDP-diacylglycerol--glycerol-3-phosphate 3-phosphatidyltransferase n=1 Tax=Wansuia hejianensis TaxID=2763667 RepID=A0A926EZS3_9FIRM|nr:CDP-diacylglycerol--glycerol-3-phosphate 3-phosphatidyltransferase [Wansuia hejianensis]MBC8590522.1 CDP-diacylglycerol--glycerol-3-phosphate 3-phosphatidyltransferase [Wansuia hejianensis]
MNLPNKITLIRVLLVPVFIVLFYVNIENHLTYAAIIFIIASLTDALDGYIARSRNLVTKFGKFMDPLADKILVTAAFVLLVEIGKIPGWIVIIILAREFAITGFRVIAASEGITIAASSLGKFKTVAQLIAIILLLLDNIIFSKLNIPMDVIMLYISLVMTVLSGIDYIYKNINTLKSDNKR